MSGRRPLISGNWKMHHTHLDAIQVVQKLAFRLSDHDYDAVNVSVHPAFTALRSVQTVLQADKVNIEASPDDSGKLYRARVTGLSKADAEKACAQLKAKKADCMVFTTEDGLAKAN